MPAGTERCACGPRKAPLICEVSDSGSWLDRPLLGRLRPAPNQIYGRGLSLVNHLCDLVQIRSRPDGNVVRPPHEVLRPISDRAIPHPLNALDTAGPRVTLTLDAQCCASPG